MKAQAEAVGVDIIQRSVELEEAAHIVLLKCARSFSPRVQDKAIDLIVLDIDGLKGLFGSPEQIARKIHSSLLRERFTGNVAVAGNPDSATIAARGYAGASVLCRSRANSVSPPDFARAEPFPARNLRSVGHHHARGLAALDAKGALRKDWANRACNCRNWLADNK